MLSSTINFCIIATIVVYLLAMLAIGFVFSKNNSDSKDFYLGGRKMGPIVTAMSAEASDMSSWLLMGLPGLAYLTGVANPAWTAIGLGIGTWFNWLIVARRLRRYSANINAITVPEFYSKRYHDNSNVLNAIAALVIIVFFIPYTASGFAACGKLFNSLFGVDYMVAMLISAAVIVGYTIMGGFKAVSTTDLIQSIVMTIALVVVVTFGISKAGGVEAVIDNAKSLPGYLSMKASYDVGTNSSTPYSFLTIVSTIAWGLGYFGMPHILLRFMAIKDEKKLVLSRRIATIWVFIAMGITIFIGMVGLGMTKAGELGFLSGSSSETIIVEIAGLISRHGVLAAIVAGLILAGILAATMSTADSQMLAAASSVSQNIVQDFFKVKISEKKSLLVARLTIVVISLIGVFLARDPNSSVFNIVSFAWAGFGGAFGAVTLCALFWKRSNKWGALAGMIGGGVMVFVWKYAISRLGGAWSIYELLPAFIFSLILDIVVSLLTKKPDETIAREFEAAKTK
ncbi:MAG TPA: sodium/proline symporter [Lachnospiraceae bacterium]|jgi:sodium/proline symporter|nr:putative sodium/proline symporter [Butyrivibrio sp. CAG:318]HJI32188.1 sodium/proline symporter [Lachnospiraceae bacterium]